MIGYHLLRELLDLGRRPFLKGKLAHLNLRQTALGCFSGEAFVDSGDSRKSCPWRSEPSTWRMQREMQ